MINALIGQKKDQTQKFLQDGTRIPVTQIAVLDNAVVQVKLADKDTYQAVQLGYGQRKKADKALLGHAKKASLQNAPWILQEVRLSDSDESLKAGEKIAVDSVFKPGDIVQVTGVSKGKGFAGVVKRHHFRGGPKTHGQSDRLRAPGSIGQTTTPGRVYRGKRMAGRMGSERVTIKNLQIVDVDSANKILFVLGLVPGHHDAFVFVEKVGENKKNIPLIDSVHEAMKKAKEVKEQEEAQAAKAALEAKAQEEAKETEETKETVKTEEKKEE